MRGPDELDIVVLNPSTIPDYAAKTGRDEEELLQEYKAAKAEDKALFGCYIPGPYWIDEVSTDDGMA